MLAFEAGKPGGAPRACELGLGALGEGDEERRVAMPGRLRLVGLQEPLLGVEPDGLQEAVPVLFGVAATDLDERLVHEPGQQVEHAVGVKGNGAAHLLGGLQREPADKDR